MEKLIIRYAEKEELETVNKIRKQVNGVHVIGRSDVFRDDGWQFIEPFIHITMKTVMVSLLILMVK